MIRKTRCSDIQFDDLPFRDGVAGQQDDKALCSIPQFSHISLPGIAFKEIQGPLSDLRHGYVLFFAGGCDEVGKGSAGCHQASP